MYFFLDNLDDLCLTIHFIFDARNLRAGGPKSCACKVRADVVSGESQPGGEGGRLRALALPKGQPLLSSNQRCCRNVARSSQILFFKRSWQWPPPHPGVPANIPNGNKFRGHPHRRFSRGFLSFGDALPALFAPANWLSSPLTSLLKTFNFAPLFHSRIVVQGPSLSSLPPHRPSALLVPPLRTKALDGSPGSCGENSVHWWSSFPPGLVPPYPSSFGFCHSLRPADSPYFPLIQVPQTHVLLPAPCSRTCGFLSLTPLPCPPGSPLLTLQDPVYMLAPWRNLHFSSQHGHMICAARVASPSVSWAHSSPGSCSPPVFPAVFLRIITPMSVSLGHHLAWCLVYSRCSMIHQMIEPMSGQ